MAFTMIQRLLRRLGSTFRSPDRAAVTDARAVERDIAAETRAVDDEANALARDDIPRVIECIRSARAAHAHEAIDLFHALYRLRMTAIDQLRFIELTVKQYEEHGDGYSGGLKDCLMKYRDDLVRLVQDIFEEETSVESLQPSLLKLVDFCAQARKLHFDLLHTKEYNRKIRKTLKKERRHFERTVLRTDKPLPYLDDAIKTLGSFFKSDLGAMHAAAEDALVLLREDMDAILAQEKHITELVERAKIAKPIGEQLRDEAHDAMSELRKMLKEEVAQTRIDLSIAKRAA